MVMVEVVTSDGRREFGRQHFHQWSRHSIQYVIALANEPQREFKSCPALGCVAG